MALLMPLKWQNTNRHLGQSPRPSIFRNDPNHCDVAFSRNLARYFDGPRKHFEGGLVLVFDCCVTDDHKFSALNRHKSLILQFLRNRLWAQPNWVSCSRSHKPTIKVLARTHSHLELSVLLHGDSGCRQSSVPDSYRTEALSSCSLPIPPGCSWHGCLLLQGQQESFLLFKGPPDKVRPICNMPSPLPWNVTYAQQ